MTSIIKRLIGAVFLIVLMFGFWCAFSYQQSLILPHPVKTPVTFEITAGDGAYKVVDRLHQEGIVSEPLLAKLYLRLNKSQQAIQTGLYKIDPGVTLPNIFAQFVAGKQVHFQISLIEGLRFKEVLESIRANANITHNSEGFTQEQLLGTLNSSYSHVEGSLFADTYSFPYGYSDIELIQRAHQRLQKVLSEEWENRSENLPYGSPYEALIMASIIEKETGLSSERPKIAGVFVRRLQKNMRLQTDPTVIYGIGDEYDGDIKRVHLRTDTPYNTYTRKGLPPTPIAIVGREAIHAALHPAAGTELYFVAKGDGSHQFSDTLKEHNKAVRKYQLNR